MRALRLAFIVTLVGGVNVALWYVAVIGILEEAKK